MEQMERQLTEQRACDKCKEPSCLGDFKQVAGLKKSGLLIYVPKDAEYAEQHAQHRKKKDFFILHNASDRKLIRPDYVKEMCQYRTKCFKCREFIHRVRNLIDEISDIKQNEVIGVCHYCKRLNPSGNCKRCEYFVNKFKCYQATQEQEKHERFISWLHKINVLIQSILESKDFCTSKFFIEPTYLNDLLKLLEEPKPLFDLGLPNISLLSNVMNAGNVAKIIEMMEELLPKMKYDTRTLPRMASPSMEYRRLTFMDSLAKNKGKLEDILLKMQYDIDIRLLSKMLECACGADDNLAFGRLLSMESLAKHKKMLEELLLQIKYDRLKERSFETIIGQEISSNKILPDLKMKISELIKPPKKENVFKKFIEVMSQKGTKKDESTLEKTIAKGKTLVPVYNNNKNPKKKLIEKQTSRNLKPELSKGRHSKRRDSFDTTSDNVFDDTDKRKDSKDSDSNKTASKDFVTGQTIKVQDEKHDSVDTKEPAPKKLLASKFTTHDLAKDAKKGKLAGKMNTMHPDSFGELFKPLTKDRKVVELLDDKKKIPGTVSKKEPLLYSRQKFEDLDKIVDNPCPLMVTAVDDDQEEKQSQRNRSLLRLSSHDETRGQNGFLYKLSDRKFIKNGWTIMPKMKTLRKVRIYKMEPALPQYDWFENNKMKKTIFYDSGEKVAEIDDDGHGRWFYKNGEVALDFHNTEEGSHAGQRYVVYSRGDDVDMGKTPPRTVLASFDHRGNGVVYDRDGNERLKYNQFEGVLHDDKVGPTSRWKWHSLNEPPELHESTVDNYVKEIVCGFKDILEKVNAKENPRKSLNQMSKLKTLPMESENSVKSEDNRLTPKIKPFKIRMKALKMNDNFSLRVLDQANIYVLFRDGRMMQKLNVGMNLINEVIDVETIATEDVVTPYNQLPPLSQSLENIQKNVGKVRRLAKMRAEKTERLRMPPKISRSAYKVCIGMKESDHYSVQTQVHYPAFQMRRREKD